jgi:class 3 adenylate cyclase
MLVEFAIVDAVRCAVEVQRGIAEQNAAVAQDQRIEFRVGIHVGDFIFDDNDIFGDGINIAARPEGIAEAGGVCMSDDAYRQIRSKVEIACDDLGPQTLKMRRDASEAAEADGTLRFITSYNTDRNGMDALMKQRSASRLSRRVVAPHPAPANT